MDWVDARLEAIRAGEEDEDEESAASKKEEEGQTAGSRLALACCPGPHIRGPAPPPGPACARSRPQRTNPPEH
jgi:hypothetical protein